MGETFYSVLEVSAEAEPDQIRRAYRQRVKESHPDLNDADATPREFKRLTTARDVLLDADERSTYDRLGHTTYVDRHVDAAVWQPSPRISSSRSEPSAPDRTDDRGANTTAGHHHRSNRTHTGEGSQWSAGGKRYSHTDRTSTRNTGSSKQERAEQHSHWGTDSTQAQHGEPNESRTATGTTSRSNGGYAHRGWQRAPDAYHSAGSYLGDETKSRLASILDGVRTLGLWVVVHTVVIASAMITGILLVASIGADPMVSAAAGLFLALLIGTVAISSLLHLLVELY